MPANSLKSIVESNSLQETSTVSQCPCQQSGADCLSCLDHALGAVEPLLPDLSSPLVTQQSPFEPPRPSLGHGQSVNEMQSYPLGTNCLLNPNLLDTTNNEQYQDQAAADQFSPAYSPILESPASSTRVTATSSWEDVRDLDRPRNITPLSEEDLSVIRASSARAATQHPSNARQSSYPANSHPTTPFSVPKTPSLSGSELHTYFDVSSPASDNGSPTSPQSLSLTLPKQNIQKVGKRRQLTLDERKNAKTVRKMGACVRCRVFKLKVSFCRTPSSQGSHYLSPISADFALV